MTWSIAAVELLGEVGAAAAGADEAGCADASVDGVDGCGFVVAVESALAGADDAAVPSITPLVLAVEPWFGAAVRDSPVPPPPPPQADKTRARSKVEGIVMRFKSLLLELRIGDYLH